MKPMTLEEMAKAVNGHILAGQAGHNISSVAIDSRKIERGGLYVALTGGRTDGHDYISPAIDAGAAALLVTHLPKGLTALVERRDIAVIQVADTARALCDLAAYYIAGFKLHRVGVTGSTGKTTTKEMLYWILAERFRTVSNRGNYNNLIGLPLSVFQIEEATEAAVFEMGMDRLGEIHELADIIRPTIGIITNIGLSHAERLGSRENIRRAKMELVDFFGSSHTLVVNCDDDMLQPPQCTKCSGNYRLVTAGHAETADYRIVDKTDLGEAGVSFRLIGPDGEGQFEIGAPGLHNVSNAALAIAAACTLGMTMEEIRPGLAKLTCMDKRLNIQTLAQLKIIDDSYNASPDSMRAALDVLKRVEGNRKIAILGDMFELGETSAACHFEMGEYAARSAVDIVISVGQAAEQITEGARRGGIRALHYSSKELLYGVLKQWIRPGDVVLVKGSRGMAMEEIIEQIVLVAGQQEEFAK